MNTPTLSTAASTVDVQAHSRLQAPSLTPSVSSPHHELPFVSMVSDMIHEVDAQQQVVAADVQKLANGEVDNLQQVATNVAKADLSFRFLMELRDRLITSYQEIMRMQV